MIIWIWRAIFHLNILENRNIPASLHFCIVYWKQWNCIINLLSVIFIINYYFVTESKHTNMHFILLTMLLFIKLCWYKERVVSLFTKFLLEMKYLYICQQPGNPDLFKGPWLASPGRLMNELQYGFSPSVR